METNQSNHYKNKRSKREEFISKYCNGDGIIVDGFIVDKGHPKGAEVHSITENGIIIVHNYSSGKLVTKLLARPHQIMRYYKATGREYPPELEHILELARLHNILGYNEI